MLYKIKKVLNYLLIKNKFRKIKGVKIKSINISKDIKLEEYVQIPKRVYIRNNVKIGKATYLSANTVIESNVTIGKFCSIAPYVHIAPGEHYTKFVTTHPILFDPVWRKILNIEEKSSYIRKIGKTDSATIIGNDVWIGLGAIIKRGIKIGDGAVIGAGAIITKDVPDYAIVVGCPGKVLKYRFDNEYINKLKKICWWNKENLNIDKMYDIKRIDELK